MCVPACGFVLQVHVCVAGRRDVLHICIFVRLTRIVMFKRVDTDVPVDAYRNNPHYLEAMALYVMSTRHELPQMH